MSIPADQPTHSPPNRYVGSGTARQVDRADGASERSDRRGRSRPYRRREWDADQRDGAGRLREGGRCVRRQLRRPRRTRRGVRAVRRRRLQGRHLGRRRRQDDRPGVGRGHAAARVLDDEGRCRDLCGPARRGGQDRLRRAGRVVLAGVRGGGQGGDHGRSAAEPPGRAAVRRRAADVRRRHRRRPGRRRARRTEAGLGAGQRPRLPRPDLRLARRRTGPPGRRSSDRAVLRRRGGRPARPRLLDRPARVGGASCVAARAVAAAVRSGGARADDVRDGPRHERLQGADAERSDERLRRRTRRSTRGPCTPPRCLRRTASRRRAASPGCTRPPSARSTACD